MAEVACPFCGYTGDEGYAVQLHIEEHHTEDSPFLITNSAPGPPRQHGRSNDNSQSSLMPDDEWTKCTRQGCGEYVALSDIDEHLELHEAMTAVEDEERRPNGHESTSSYRDASTKDSPRSPRKLKRSHQSETNSRGYGRSLLDYFSGTSYYGPPPQRRRIREPREPGRLGKRELGPHAFEKSMPFDVRRTLLNDAIPYYTNRIGRDGRLIKEMTVDNETSGLIHILADLCALDSTTEATYFCNPSVKHVRKLRCDGNFCGYWNVQMLVSYLDHNLPAREMRPLPNILQIQDQIEQAWENGICSYGRIETGGVRGTRKWIGTHEALAFFTQIGVKIEALSFREEEGDTASQPAVLALLDHIEAYFISGIDASEMHGTSHTTRLSPIYFQRFGHSMTIVGLERKAGGSRNLLVFDPSFETAEAVKRFLAGRRAYASPETLLKAYRRSDVSLSRWEEFEIVV